MNIVFLFYHGMTALDAIGPHEILYRLPEVSIKRVAQTAGQITTDSELQLYAEYSIFDISSADILFIPGANNATTLREATDILDWVRLIQIKRSGQHRSVQAVSF